MFAGWGYGYGPVFRGLCGAWRRGGELFAEVVLPEVGDAGRFVVHPALLDAAMHVTLGAGTDSGGSGAGAGGGGVVIPFVWNGVSRGVVSGVSRARVRVCVVEGVSGGLVLEVADEVGRPVLRVDSMVGRAITPEQLRPAGADRVYGLDWIPASAGEAPEWGFWSEVIADAEALVPPVVVFDAREPADGGVPVRVRSAVAGVLEVVRRWLSEPRWADARLVVLTRNAVGLDGDTEVRVESAPVWGVVRAAQAEHPGRFAVLDTDTDTADITGVTSALAVVESEIAIRGGQVLVPRVVALSSSDGSGSLGSGCVLITGGTGGIGAVLARHVVAEHGVRDLVLASRRGPDADGVPQLVRELRDSGARVEVVAADLSNRDAVLGLVDGIGDRLSAVVHAAGVGDNGLVESLTPERMDPVLAAKADSAWYLHEATLGRELAAFVLISSIGGLLLPAGQGNYAAANNFLDTLATQRHKMELPATSMLFGLWDINTGMSSHIGDIDRQRMRAKGLPALTEQTALGLFDTALHTSRPVVITTQIDTT
ncbi:SDR family oxidoreductase, partial [Amycolatopsis minnesotensis]|uniref:SDR family oxidoreductase n=1 Tax=Amycolatopsis minnesotensis TaxID=337894 RepID=UPI0031DB2A44